MSLGQATVPLPRARSTLLAWLSAFAVLAAAIAQHAGATLNPDNSWLLTIGEKWLAGQVPYVDFVEVNPPASILLYMPAVALAHWLDIRPEILVTLMMFAGVVAGLALTGRILRSADLLDAAPLPWLLAAALFVFAILPANTFAQREHIAAVLVLPALATYRVGIAGRALPLHLRILAGLAGGLCIVIKPYFAGALLLPLAYGVLAADGSLQRRVGLLFSPTNWVIALLVCAYGAMVLALFPAFVQSIMPLLVDAYLPVRVPLWRIATTSSLCVVVPFLICGLFDRKGFRTPETMLLLLATIGFALAVIAQGKSWPYHYYPVLSLGLLTLARSLILQASRKADGRQGLVAFAAGILGLCLVASLSYQLLATRSDSEQLLAAVRRVAPPHPKIVTITSDLAVGHPLTRALSGQWISRFSARWITANGEDLVADPDLDEATRARLMADLALDRDTLVQELDRDRPDVVLVDGEGWWSWINADAAVRRALGPYRVVEGAGKVSILLRRDAGADPGT